MRNLLVMTAVAVFFGALAVVGVRVLLEGQRASASVATQETRPVSTIVVAGRDIAAGARIARADLREIPWAAEERPQGSHQRIDALLQGNAPLFARVELPALLPVIDRDLTGDLSQLPAASRLAPGRKAMAIHLDEKVVAGQRLDADDRVDILMTHTGSGNGMPYVDVILEDIRVLAVDRQAENGAQRGLTLEVTTEQAQILTLAMRNGILSFILRGAAVAPGEDLRRVTLDDILGTQPSPEPEPEVLPREEPRKTSVRVNRKGGKTDYDVVVSPR